MSIPGAWTLIHPLPSSGLNSEFLNGVHANLFSLLLLFFLINKHSMEMDGLFLKSDQLMCRTHYKFIWETSVLEKNTGLQVEMSPPARKFSRPSLSIHTIEIHISFFLMRKKKLL